MSDPITILQVCEFLDCGDGVHRFHAPARALSRLPGVTVIDCDLHHRLFPALAEGVDVVVMAAFNADLLPIFERRRKAGRITVVEANDYYPDLQAWNPLSMRWLDRSLQDSFHHALRLADGIQASMPALAVRWKRWTDVPIAAFPNHLEEVPPLPGSRPDRPLTVGWGGSPGHFADWYAVAPLLQRWLERRPEVHLAVMNNEYARGFIHLPPERYHYRPFGSLDDWFDFLAGLDIGLAPLLPSEYNRCRSDVKFLEYASRGVAGIYRSLDPYQGVVVHGETGMLYDSDEGLLRALDALADDASLRARIREQAWRYVDGERRLDDRIHERLDFYRSLMASRHAAPASLPSLEDAVVEGRYIQLRPGPAEEVVRKILSDPVDRNTPARLAEVVRRHPRYLSALQLLGQALNQAGRPAEALSALEAAHALDGERARTLSEMGRALLLLGRKEEARARLEQAVDVNPRFQPSWEYLLRFLVRGGASADLRSFARRAHEGLPCSYPIALLGASLLPPDERVPLLTEYVEEYARSLDPQEVHLAAPRFSEAIAALGDDLHTSAGRSLLALAAARFPQSWRIAALHADVLARAGEKSASEEAARARELRRTAELYRGEMMPEDGRLHVWQFAEHIRAVRGGG
jgi:tetratricopeptide (TPR) repeat protein